MLESITFLLPAMGNFPSGGVKVVYEYANRLAEDDYDVRIVFPASLCFNERSLGQKVRSLLRYIYYLITRKYTPYHWFNLDCRIKLLLVWSLAEKRIISSDIYIATAVETSEYLQSYKIASKFKFYLIQGYESWDVGEHRLCQTYRFQMHKIVIAKWLQAKIEMMGEKATLIYNGFDFNYFKKSVRLCDRDKYSLAMLYHPSIYKGCEDGYKALSIVKKKYSQLKVRFYGAYPRPSELPDWCSYVEKPDQLTHNLIYNEAAIFVGTSHTEGWGLTIGEAMICGAAVVCTDNAGYLEMAEHNVTALVSPIHSPELLARNIICLIEDDSLRIRIAQAGYENIMRFSWDRSYAFFKKRLMEEM